MKYKRDSGSYLHFENRIFIKRKIHQIDLIIDWIEENIEFQNFYLSSNFFIDGNGTITVYFKNHDESVMFKLCAL